MIGVRSSASSQAGRIDEGAGLHGSGAASRSHESLASSGLAGVAGIGRGDAGGTSSRASPASAEFCEGSAFGQANSMAIGICSLGMTCRCAFSSWPTTCSKIERAADGAEGS